MCNVSAASFDIGAAVLDNISASVFDRIKTIFVGTRAKQIFFFAIERSSNYNTVQPVNTPVFGTLLQLQ